jgi:hypothetical protein
MIHEHSAHRLVCSGGDMGPVVNSAPDPVVPPLWQILDEIFTEEERARFEQVASMRS